MPKVSMGGGVNTVVMSASIEPRDRDECSRAGIAHFMAKPFVAEELYALLNELLEKEKGNALEFEGELFNAQQKAQLLGWRESLGQEFVSGLMEIFREEMKEGKKLLNEAISRRDQNEVLRVAHKLKSGALNLGYEAVVQTLSSIEETAGDQEASAANMLKLASVFSMSDKHLRDEFEPK